MSADCGSCGRDECGCGGNEMPLTPGEAESSLLDRLDNETGFHPMGEGWEEEMREMLDDTEYDTDLGMEMARDAMRLVAGEIEEEEFYDQYHDDILEEFGEDERPMAGKFDPDDLEDPGLLESIADLGDTDVSRRDTMKKMAFGAGAVGLGGILPREQSDNDDGNAGSGGGGGGNPSGDGIQYGMVIDLDRCDACLECVIGCMDENRWDTGANWMYVLTWRDDISDEIDQENYLVRPCQHCTNAPCAKVCPVRARHRRENGGLVLTNYETCIGCRYCQVACPYGVNYFGWGEPEVPKEELASVDHTGRELRAMSPDERADILQDSGDHVHDHRGWEVDSRPRKGTMGKCTFCPSRQDGNMGEEMVGTVACMEACDDAGMSAIHFGDLNNPDSRPNRYLRRRQEVEPEITDKFDEDTDEEWTEGDDFGTGSRESQLSAFKLLEEMGTQPNIIYLGNEPGPNAKEVPSEEAPVDYNADFVRSRVDDRPIVARTKDATDERTDWRAWEAGD